MQICKEWIKTGACTVSYCKFKHFDPNASYPNFVRPVDNDRSKVSRENSKWTPADRPTKSCYQFRDFGYWEYGNRCRFEHIRPTTSYDNHKSRAGTAALRKYSNIYSVNFSQRSSEDIVKQATSLGPILNNCSLSDICADGRNVTFGSVEVKSLEFVDDIVDPSYGKSDAVLSNDIICDTQRMKRLKFSTEKYRLLINGEANDDTVSISGRD